MKLSMRIRIARQRARLSQEALAVNLGVTRSAVANWECADGVLPASSRLSRLAELTNVSFEWLATGRGAIDHACKEATISAIDGEVVYDEWERRLLAAFRRMTERARREVLMQSEATASAASQKGARTR
jgi:transcriptional regulator with XRE-family HTH domain